MKRRKQQITITPEVMISTYAEYCDQSCAFIDHDGGIDNYCWLFRTCLSSDSYGDLRCLSCLGEEIKQ
jgi:hypothetical protein